MTAFYDRDSDGGFVLYIDSEFIGRYRTREEMIQTVRFFRGYEEWLASGWNK